MFKGIDLIPSSMWLEHFPEEINRKLRVLRYGQGDVDPIMPGFSWDTHDSGNCKTDLSKILTYMIQHSLEMGIEKYRLGHIWQVAPPNQKAYDHIINGQQVEMKFSLSVTGFTGSSHSNTKVDLYLLGKIGIYDNIFDRMHISFVDLADCHHPESGWSHKKMTEDQLARHNKKSAFSNLQIHKDDWEVYQIVWGDLTKSGGNRKWCREDLVLLP